MRIFSATPTVSLLNRPEMPTIANLGEDRAISALDADLAALYRPTKKREISNGIPHIGPALDGVDEATGRRPSRKDGAGANQAEKERIDHSVKTSHLCGKSNVAGDV
jgi:hypothetical protein